MIEIIFEGGYTYLMAESEYQMLIALAGIGSATVISGIITLGYFGIRQIIKRIKA